MELTRPSSGDWIAGLSVALVAIPQSLAYAELAGMPPQFGLYATALPSLLAAVFVSSRYLQTGPVALTALLTFGALTPLADEATSHYIALAALLALMVGILRVAFGFVRLGRVAYLLTPPVLVGFTTGAAILITASQLPKALGVTGGDGGVLANAFDAVTSPGSWQFGAIVFAVMAITLTLWGRHVHRLFPGVLLAVVVGVVASALLDYDGAIVGELDGAFITLGWDFPWSDVGTLIVPAIAIALVGFAEPASIARTFAEQDGEPWNANREMVSQGVANLAAGISGAFPVGGSFSRSSLNRLAGATSPWAGAITGAVVLLVLPLTPVLETLPQAVLGAIVIGAVAKLIQLGSVRNLAKQSLVDGALAVATLIATLATAPRVERGVMVGIALSLLVTGGRHLARRRVVAAADGDRLPV